MGSVGGHHLASGKRCCSWIRSHWSRKVFCVALSIQEAKQTSGCIAPLSPASQPTWGFQALFHHVSIFFPYHLASLWLLHFSSHPGSHSQPLPLCLLLALMRIFLWLSVVSNSIIYHWLLKALSLWKKTCQANLGSEDLGETASCYTSSTQPPTQVLGKGSFGVQG